MGIHQALPLGVHGHFGTGNRGNKAEIEPNIFMDMNIKQFITDEVRNLMLGLKIALKLD